MAYTLYEFYDSAQNWHAHAVNDRFTGQSVTIGTIGEKESIYLKECCFMCRRSNENAFDDVYLGVHKFGVEMPLFRSESLDVSGVNFWPDPYEWITFSFNNGILKKNIPYYLMIHAETELINQININGGTVDGYSGGGKCFYSDLVGWHKNNEDIDFKLYGLKAQDAPHTKVDVDATEDLVSTGAGRNADKYINEVFCIETDLFKAVGKHVDLINKKKDKIVKDLKRCFTNEN